MIRRGINLLFISLLLGFSGNALSVEVDNLYQASVEVTSRDNERERQSAFTNAFRQVLVKVSGNTEILSQATVRRALANADDYVDTWSYRNVRLTQESDSGNGTEGRQVNSETDVSGEIVALAENAEALSSIAINVTFFEPEVLSLLDNANIPFWPKNRPYTLVWLVVQDELGEREVLGSSSNNLSEILTLVDTEARKRALPWLLPILDFEDLRQVSADDVWEMDTEKLLQASSKYQSESVLVIRLYRTFTGEVIGKSNYLFRDQIHTLEVFEAPIETFIQESVALATDEISAYYSVLISGTDSSMEVNLTVEGIESAADYAALLNYVTQLTDVNDYHIAMVEKQTIMLRLSTGGQIRQLVETIALNRTLLPLGELLRNENQVFMTYQWNQ